MSHSVPSWENLQKRAHALEALRQFFRDTGYLEIESRAMRAASASDPYIESFRTVWCDADKPAFLQPSPEYAHKILLSQHRRPIFEIARVFRNEPHGALHRREFTLAEWYHPDWDYRDMMQETEELVRCVSASLGTEQWRSSAREDNCCIPVLPEPFERISVADAFLRWAGFSPIGLSHDDLYDAARQAGSRVHKDWSWNDIMDCVLVDLVEPHLGMDHPVFLTDYPASMASLAQIRHENTGDVAERFELYICGIELCNGYSELNDPAELRARFDEDNRERARLGLMPVPADEDLLRALPALGKLGGNAVGFERLLMLCLGCNDIGEVMLEV